jgi:hypothetical protein
MKRAILFLSLALTFQIALALGLQLAANTTDSGAGQGKLLPIDAERVDTLVIEGRAGESVLLRKTDGHWTLPDHFGAPADSRKIKELLDTLTGIERSWPVAETAEARRRFKVGNNDFERRLRFKTDGEELAVLYLGTSPGFRKIHARLDGEDQVFDIPFSTYQAGTKNSDWLDKQQLWVDSDSVTAIELPDCRLSRHDGTWTMADLAANEEIDQQKADQLARRLARLNCQDISAKADEPPPGPAAFKVRLEFKDGTSRDYRFVKEEDQAHALLKVSEKPFLYQVGTTVMKEVQDFTRSSLIKAREEEAPASTQAEEEQQKPRQATGVLQ